MCDRWVAAPVTFTESELAELEKGPAPEISPEARAILAKSDNPLHKALLSPDRAVSNKARVALMRRDFRIIPG